MHNWQTIYIIIVLLIILFQGLYFIHYYVEFKLKVAIYYAVFLLLYVFDIMLLNREHLFTNLTIDVQISNLIIQLVNCVSGIIYYKILLLLFNFKKTNRQIYRLIQFLTVLTSILFVVVIIFYLQKLNINTLVNNTLLFLAPLFLWIVFAIWKRKEPFATYIKYGLLCIIIGISIPTIISFIFFSYKYQPQSVFFIPAQIALVIDTLLFSKAILCQQDGYSHYAKYK